MPYFINFSSYAWQLVKAERDHELHRRVLRLRKGQNEGYKNVVFKDEPQTSFEIETAKLPKYNESFHTKE